MMLTTCTCVCPLSEVPLCSVISDLSIKKSTEFKREKVVAISNTTRWCSLFHALGENSAIIERN